MKRDIGGEMSFIEIGRALGVSRARAWQIAQSALKKLRENPRAIAALKALAEIEEQRRMKTDLESRRIA